MHTAGTSSQISDGAAAVLHDDPREGRRPRPHARWPASSTPAWSASTRCSCSPARSTPPSACSSRNGLTMADIDVVEINEAFASVVLAWAARARRRPRQASTPTAAPSPWATRSAAPAPSSSPRRVHELRAHRRARCALVTMCCGGGLGTGTLIERALGSSSPTPARRSASRALAARAAATRSAPPEVLGVVRRRPPVPTRGVAASSRHPSCTRALRLAVLRRALRPLLAACGGLAPAASPDARPAPRRGRRPARHRRGARRRRRHHRRRARRPRRAGPPASASTRPRPVSPTKPVQCYGKQASAHTTRPAAAGHRACAWSRDVEARDNYGRLLAYVYRHADGLFVNLELAARRLRLAAHLPAQRRPRAAARAAVDRGPPARSGCGAAAAARACRPDRRLTCGAGSPSAGGR